MVSFCYSFGSSVRRLKIASAWNLTKARIERSWLAEPRWKFWPKRILFVQLWFIQSSSILPTWINRYLLLTHLANIQIRNLQAMMFQHKVVCVLGRELGAKPSW